MGSHLFPLRYVATLPILPVFLSFYEPDAYSSTFLSFTPGSNVAFSWTLYVREKPKRYDYCVEVDRHWASLTTVR